MDINLIKYLKFIYGKNPNKIGLINLNRWYYMLSKHNEKQTEKFLNYRFSDKNYTIVATFDIQFMSLKDLNYILLTSGSNNNYMGVDPFDKINKIKREFIVLAKYKKGMLQARQTPPHEAMEDICYFERISSQNKSLQASPKSGAPKL